MMPRMTNALDRWADPEYQELRARLETAERERDEARSWNEYASQSNAVHERLLTENRLLREQVQIAVDLHKFHPAALIGHSLTTAEAERVKRLERFWETAKVIFVNDAVSAHQIEDAWVDFGEALDALAGEEGVSEDSG